MFLVGVDVGGTFTDIVLTDTEAGRSHVHKVPTTVDDPSHGIVTGLAHLTGRLGLEPCAGYFVHPCDKFRSFSHG